MSQKHERRRHEQIARETASWRSWAIGDWFTNGYMALMLDEPISKHDMRLDFECLCDGFGKHEHRHTVDRLCTFVDAYERDADMRGKLTRFIEGGRQMRGNRYATLEREPLDSKTEPGLTVYRVRVDDEDSPRAWFAINARYAEAIEKHTRTDRWLVVQRADQRTAMLIALRGSQGVAMVMPMTARGSAIELAE